MSLNPESKDRVRLLLVAIGMAMLAVLFILATAVLIPQPFRGEIDWKWVRFAVVTVCFVGYCLKTYWRARKHLGFWVILLGIFVVHFVGAGYFYYAGNGLPLLVFGPTVALEWALLALAVSWA